MYSTNLSQMYYIIFFVVAILTRVVEYMYATVHWSLFHQRSMARTML
jgi:hypothetical protein